MKTNYLELAENEEFKEKLYKFYDELYEETLKESIENFLKKIREEEKSKKKNFVTKFFSKLFNTAEVEISEDEKVCIFEIEYRKHRDKSFGFDLYQCGAMFMARLVDYQNEKEREDNEKT